MPLARSVAATAAASTESSKSIVPTTSERLACVCTNGDANSELPAQLYRCEDDSWVRATQNSWRPPPAFIQSTCSASSHRVASAGVL